MAKRYLVFNCVWGFEKKGMGSILFRFYLLALLLGSQGVLSPVVFPGNSPWLSRDSSEGQRNPDLAVGATRIYHEGGQLAEGAWQGLPC